MKIKLLLLVLFVSQQAIAQVDDAQQIRETLKKIYEHLSFRDNKSETLDSIKNYFTLNARITANVGAAPMHWNIDEYIASVRQNVKTQQVVSMNEKELFQKTDIFGKVPMYGAVTSLQ